METKLKVSKTVKCENTDIPQLLEERGYQMVAGFGIKHIQEEEYESLLICEGEVKFLEMIRDVAIQQLERLKQ